MIGAFANREFGATADTITGFLFVVSVAGLIGAWRFSRNNRPRIYLRTFYFATFISATMFTVVAAIVIANNL
ncbi:hypothetical protein [Breoghania sp.]|uniref:hypothetical protein n=1 Tax=Breoghania sp. TaxID=2065378 RepID=UPI002622F8DF|nr:hypothetical protein [Breoghania sp.]MDJ0930352.1 hypothetical protein [Breoghania sp.]